MNDLQVSQAPGLQAKGAAANSVPGSTDFSRWGLVLARSKTHRLKSVLLNPHDSGFFRALSRILVTSPRYGAHQRGPGLSWNIDSSAFAQLVGAADALARGVHPSGKRTPLDGHVHSGHAVPPRQSQVAPRSRAAG